MSTNPAARPQYEDNSFTTFAGLAARVSALERVVNAGGLTGDGAFRSNLSTNTPADSAFFAPLLMDVVSYDLSGSYDVKQGVYSPNVAGYYFVYAEMYVNALLDDTKVVLFIAKNNHLKVPDSPVQVQTTLHGSSSGDADLSVPAFGVFYLDGIADFIQPGYANSKAMNIVSGYPNTFFGGFLVAQSQGAQGG